MNLAWVAIIVSIVALLTSAVFFFTTLQLRKTEVPELRSILERVENVEKKVSEVQEGLKSQISSFKSSSMVPIALRKAILALEEARSISKDEDLIERIKGIEEEIKGLPSLQGKETQGGESQR